MNQGRPRIGIVGIGSMGEPMARALQTAGFTVTAAAHRNAEPLRRLAEAGVAAAANPAAVARDSEVMITMVPDAPQVEEAYFGAEGLVAGARAGSYFIDMSTISPPSSRGFDERLAVLGMHFVDAPVSGGPARAADGSLTIMAGAREQDYAAVEPVLRAMGTPFHVGPVGTGETVKLVNQLIIANVMLANAEALTFATKSGVPAARVLPIIAASTGANYLLEKWLPQKWLAGSFEGGFALDLLRKDLTAALDTARAMGLFMPASSLASQLFTAASAQGEGRSDYSAVARLYELLADVTVRNE